MNRRKNYKSLCALHRRTELGVRDVDEEALYVIQQRRKSRSWMQEVDFNAKSAARENLETLRTTAAQRKQSLNKHEGNLQTIGASEHVRDLLHEVSLSEQEVYDFEKDFEKLQPQWETEDEFAVEEQKLVAKGFTFR